MNLVHTITRLRHRFRAMPPSSGPAGSIDLAAIDDRSRPDLNHPPEAEGLASILLLAEEAKARNEWALAAKHYAAAIDAGPATVAHYVACAEAYRYAEAPDDADQICQTFTKTHDAAVEIGVCYAVNAQHRQDWDAAAERWRALRVAFPDISVAWAAETAMLIILGRITDAEALVSTALSRFPINLDVLAQGVGVSIAACKYLEAAALLARIDGLESVPPQVQDHIVGLQKAVDAGLSATLTADLITAARTADELRDWNIAQLAWGLIYDRDPDNGAAAIGRGQALREMRRFAEADDFLEDALSRMPDNIELLANHAQVAAAAKDWHLATARWQNILGRFPNIPALWQMAAIAYHESGDWEGANTLLANAIAGEPDRVDLRIQFAHLAERQQDWRLAVERWDLVHHLWPDEPNIRNSRGDAIWQEAIGKLERGENLPEPIWNNILSMESEVAPEEMKHICLQFEGLGDNCEFGIIQRYFGADPIGLFRFAAISAGTLIELLDEKFERLGDPEFTELALTAGNEYLVRDSRELYHLHCFVLRGTVDEAQFLHKQTVRLTYLKRKLLEDLIDGKKIFVYKSSLQRIDDETAFALHDAIKRQGGHHLLVIRLSDADARAGSVSVLRPGLLAGYVTSLYSGEGSQIDYEAWRSILVAASRYHRTAPQSWQ